MRQRTLSFAFALVTSMSFACGGDDDAVDAGPPDAGFAGTLGRTCTPDPMMMDPQGDCEDGFVCVEFEMGTGAFCTQQCVQNNDTCGDDYTGPGLPACVIQADTNGDGTADLDLCGIICRDDAGGPSFCPECDETCPDDFLSCEGTISDVMTMQPIGAVCI
jgi:hypothetical protein